MAESRYAILVTSGDRFLCEWSGSFQEVEVLYAHAHSVIGLDVQDHHWAWDARAREMIWDPIANGTALTNDACAVLIWWLVHYSLGNVLAPIALCSFRRQFDVSVGYAMKPTRFTWVDVAPCRTPRDPPPGYIEFTVLANGHEPASRGDGPDIRC